MDPAALAFTCSCHTKAQADGAATAHGSVITFQGNSELKTLAVFTTLKSKPIPVQTAYFFFLQNNLQNSKPLLIRGEVFCSV